MKNELLHLNDEEICRLAESDDGSDLKYTVLYIEKCGECREKVEKIRLAGSRASLFLAPNRKMR